MSQTLFKADEEKSQASGSNYLQTPYLGPVTFTEFSKEKVGSKENCFVAKAKLLGEDIKGNDVSGIIHNYVEWNPSGKSDEQIENAVNRLNYFIQHLVPKEEALAIQASSWEEYVDKCIMLLNQHNATERDDIVMKFTGSVWQGNPRIGTPGYHSFIANSESKEELTWSQQERKDNQEYLEVRDSTPTSPEDAEHVENLGDQKF